jgi:hypothetical protein
MSLTASYKIVCDGCGKTVRKEYTLDKEDREKDGVITSYFDPWGPGIPEGWLQTVENDKHLFFHSQECCEAWLIKQERKSEADELHNAVWMA